MPCPYFEPQRVADDPKHHNARLPLLDEYAGSCHAHGDPFPSPAELRFASCNHGNSKGCCEHFPITEVRSSLRYSVVQKTAAALEILYIEEQQYAPLRWHSIRYFLEDGRIEPEPGDDCVRAQVRAFCGGYLKRFSDRSS